jgi:ABC-2 type transport system ATP-binding protein
MGLTVPVGDGQAHVASCAELAVEVTDAHKRYGEIAALRGVDLELKAGDIVALLGRNGAGKTTLFSLISGLARADAGCVRVNGEDLVSRARRPCRAVSLAGQETAVYPSLTVRENLHLFGELAGLRRAALRNQIADLAERLSLSGRLDRRAREMSVGETRLLHVAMALMGDPTVLLLDEPTAGMDLDARRLVLAVALELAERGAAICYSTHNFLEAERLGADVAILEQGRIIARGPHVELIAATGRGAVELYFEGPPPLLICGEDDVRVAGSRVRVLTHGPPALRAAGILAELGPETRRLRSVNLLEPNLETVFLELTGKRLDDESPHATVESTVHGERSAHVG